MGAAYPTLGRCLAMADSGAWDSAGTSPAS
jgi:hypothetical protein